ncbi:MAG: hypothetical protein IM585_21320 [Pseudanabaena sp. M135S2SP2A07QC]|jgi:hypothetical protein|nr:hypothetical protein [Pseudanabaena sp. M109S1SP2A07QC]MCA6517975.1 hypothetical protein [Pseudanabaena sp. M110S1SP2A07QC]MCA6523886.1 hypothetical protein [Pseudanabaena sp. M051S1SP2A07QC]MCA6528287.1 hypothetical protein [Pseudanabaena sp. M179S2SP2A07QC]MCA6529593.1 hypothetical protein [Pseudanabaena sp. M125S2SP2A07QC]MCA6535848.1 hypothetical protein [Pseudanabaena sp. M176S2SP2A07QC]MCA6537767.1 hypothetical protein [Pseudanabaena sp. M037S2SP2A07QC]MCA6544794.1 hypothetical prot
MTQKTFPESTINLVKRASDPNTALNQNWIKANRKKYHGRWVALQGDRLLADASSSAELLKRIDLKDGKVKFITAIY